MLSKKMATSIRNDSYLLDKLMATGFVGYATFTDQQLLNGINSFATKSQDWDCQQFLASVSAEKFLLE